MIDHPNRINAHIAALYLAKYNKDAIIELGCKTWNEAYLKVGNAFDYKYTAINHFRDYFDGLLPNHRKGWGDPYELVVEIFNKFGNYDFETFSEIVKDILEENCLFDLYDSSFIANLTSIKNKNLVKQEIKTEREHKQRERNPEEEACVSALFQKEGGKREIPIFDDESGSLVGLADLITDTEIIEVKNIKNWKHAVGQVFAYWYYFSRANVNNSLRPRIHLFGNNGISDPKIQLCQFLMEKVFFPYIDSVVVTCAEDDDLDCYEIDIFDI